MKTMAVKQFENNPIAFLEQVAQTQEGIVITKNGKPLAQVIPCKNSKKHNKPGELAHTLVYEGDIVSPLGEEMWNACK